MMRLLMIVSAALFVMPLTGSAESAHTLILKGRLEEARDSLSRVASAATRDGSTLYLQGLVESDGAQAAHLLQTALESSVDSRHVEDITYRLAQYYFMHKQYDRLFEMVAEYKSRWEAGRFRAEMDRLSVLADERTNSPESALRQCDRYLTRHASGNHEQWGQIDKARLLKAGGKRIGASETLRRLSRQRDGDAIAAALFMLGSEAIERNRADDAVFYYNILREGYPAAVGLDDMMEGLGNISSAPSSGTRAEELTGTFYSIKVGVFSQQGNARKQADKFRGDHRVDIRNKKISGRDYQVVYVGRFRDYEEAVRLKLSLEAAHQEAFQVVAR